MANNIFLCVFNPFGCPQLPLVKAEKLYSQKSLNKKLTFLWLCECIFHLKYSHVFFSQFIFKSDKISCYL